MGTLKTKPQGFAKDSKAQTRPLYAYHMSHPEQGLFSYRFSIVDAANWQERHRKAIAVARLIAEYLNTPCNARYQYLRDAIGEHADDLIPLTDDSFHAWAGFVGVLKFPPGSPKYRQEDGAVVDGMTLTTSADNLRNWEVVNAEKEWRKLL